MGESVEFTCDFSKDDDHFSLDNSSGYSDNHAASPLCVPQDPIEDIELYPNFVDDLISLSGLDSWWEEYETEQQQQKTLVMLRKRVALQDCNNVFGNKKQRGQREVRRSGWSLTDGVSFSGAENVESWRQKCSHCQTTETPQWRIGPLGPKTLCNACGVRYRSGRLLPEYRPAASPTFDSHRHSNFHKKVLKKKGLMG